MKINEIKYNSSPKIYIKKQLPALSIKKETKNANHTTTPKYPKYGYALNYINFTSGFLALPKKANNETRGLKLRIPLSQEDKITLEFDRGDSWSLFFDEEDSLNLEVLNFFSKYYAEFYKIKKEAYENEKNILLSIINDHKSKKTSAIKPKEDIVNAFNANKENQTRSYGESLLNSIMDDETRKDFAIRRLNKIDREFGMYSITLAKELLIIIKLSKQDDGSIDESNFEDKLSIATLLTFYNKGYTQDYSDLIFKLSKNEKNKIDLEFCRLLIEMLTYCTNGLEPQKEIQECANKISECKKTNPDDYKDKIEEIILRHQIGNINPYFYN